jgi:large subunit ribosomal protein L19
MKADTYTKETVLTASFEGRGFPPFRPGDTIRVAERIKEGSKERIQYFEGDVIAVSNNGVSSTFTVRRIAANGIAVEKIFPYISPKIEEITFVREGDVRRAKLYYMRDRIGKKARVTEKVRTHEQKAKLQKRLAIGQVVDASLEASQVEAVASEDKVASEE